MLKNVRQAGLQSAVLNHLFHLQQALAEKETSIT